MLSWLGTRDVNQLIARRQYGRAIKELERQLRADPKSVHLRKLLADYAATGLPPAFLPKHDDPEPTA